ncbi:hypothetical protein CTAYLR_002683 [Chrysophaeum taylorii]|uniref:Uncharacterized protein n=1 Tax=Chrysophaeum taylorii TaxID=2483200 RepID=A0AAD7UDQ9_9STRA|nr:hypothetical protein CTAYLR_002683 [Chrysophaeum taylorii]
MGDHRLVVDGGGGAIEDSTRLATARALRLVEPRGHFCLRECVALETLEIEGGDASFLDVVVTQGRYPASLTSLTIRRAGLETPPAAIDAFKLLRALNLAGNRLEKPPPRIPSSLTRLDLANNKLRCVKSILPINLKTLVLSGNPLGDAGAAEVATGLSSSRVDDAFLANCDISDARCFAATIRRVRSLSLARNRISDASVVVLGRAIEDPSSRLAALDLSDNRIGPDGFAALGAALCHTKTLLSLNLDGNPVATAIALADGLRHNLALVELSLRRCALDGVVALEEAAGPQIDAIHLEQNPCPRADRERLIHFLNNRDRPSTRDRLDVLRKLRSPSVSASGGESESTTAPLVDGVGVDVAVSYGRRHNVIASIRCAPHATLLDARNLVVHDDRDFVFLRPDGVTAFPRHEEDKRLVLLDCGRHLLLRPSTWVSLAEEG